MFYSAEEGYIEKTLEREMRLTWSRKNERGTVAAAELGFYAWTKRGHLDMDKNDQITLVWIRVFHSRRGGNRLDWVNSEQQVHGHPGPDPDLMINIYMLLTFQIIIIIIFSFKWKINIQQSPRWFKFQRRQSPIHIFTSVSFISLTSLVTISLKPVLGWIIGIQLHVSKHYLALSLTRWIRIGSAAGVSQVSRTGSSLVGRLNCENGLYLNRSFLIAWKEGQHLTG